MTNFIRYPASGIRHQDSPTKIPFSGFNSYSQIRITPPSLPLKGRSKSPCDPEYSGEANGDLGVNSEASSNHSAYLPMS